MGEGYRRLRRMNRRIRYRLKPLDTEIAIWQSERAFQEEVLWDNRRQRVLGAQNAQHHVAALLCRRHGHDGACYTKADACGLANGG